MKKAEKNKEYKLIRKVLLKNFFKENKVLWVIIICLIIIASLFEIIIAWIMQYAIDSVTSKGSINTFLLNITFALIVLFMVACFRYILNKLKNKFMEKFSYYMKDQLFRVVMSRNIVDFEKSNIGDYISVFQTDILELTVNYLCGIWFIIQSVAVCVMGIASMLSMSLMISGIVLILQIIPVAVALIFGVKLTDYELKSSISRGRFAAETEDYLKGFRLIKSFIAEKAFIKRFNAYNGQVENSLKIFRDKTIKIEMINEISNYLMIILLFLLGGIQVSSGLIGIGTVIACFQLLLTISGPLSTLSHQINLVRTTNAIFMRIYNIFYAQTSDGFIADQIIEECNAEQEAVNNSTEAIHDIELKNVSFSYDEDETALKNINICLLDNQKYAIVGNSGSGKSTLLKLLLGYYSDYRGNILFNGKEITEYDIQQINQAISIVQQDVFIFNDTLMANLTLGQDFDDEMINLAIKKSGLSEFIEKKGFDYNCGENGVNLSGGEKQRISIARCLLRDSSVIFFDEATSSLDNITAIEIEKTIKSLNKICIVITHKLNLDILKNYDCIFVLDKGQIVEKGTVNELMNKKGKFFSLYNYNN